MGLGGRRGLWLRGSGQALSAALEHRTRAPTGRCGLGAPRGVGGAMLHTPFLVGRGGIVETLVPGYRVDTEGAPGKWWGAR